MFKLLIESSKDITSLSINFADGTSSCIENSNIESSQEIQEFEKPEKPEKSEDKFNEAKNELLDFDSKTQKGFEKPKIPEIPERERTPNVANEIQNLEI